MNGQNSRSLVKNEASVPNGIFFNPNSEKILVCDGNDINVKSYAPKGNNVKKSFKLQHFYCLVYFCNVKS